MNKEPLINILIRTSNRPEAFKRCLKSVVTQSYPNIRIIISVDNDQVGYIPAGLEVIMVYPNKELAFYYDEYCNDLKELVTDGWFMYLDDDDWLPKDVLKEIYFDSPAIIHKLNRNGNIVPRSEIFTRGQIGMPCLLLHHSLKSIANVPGTGQGDYFWIKAISEQVELVFRDLIVVESMARGMGK